MPIIVNLDMLLVKRRMRLTELADRVDITLANLSILKQNKARAIRFSTLESLCRELDCQPGDLLEYQPAQPAARWTARADRLATVEPPPDDDGGDDEPR